MTNSNRYVNASQAESTRLEKVTKEAKRMQSDFSDLMSRSDAENRNFARSGPDRWYDMLREEARNESYEELMGHEKIENLSISEVDRCMAARANSPYERTGIFLWGPNGDPNGLRNLVDYQEIKTRISNRTAKEKDVEIMKSAIRAAAADIAEEEFRDESADYVMAA